MDQDAIVGQLVSCCKSAIEAILQPGAHGDVASASLAILAKFRDVGRAVLQAKVDLEAARLPEGSAPLEKITAELVTEVPPV